MRPKFLEFEGLHSFSEAVWIDFELLGQTGLFGIFGPTGSGKSTVLDALTLALYGEVTRADRGTHGIINMGCAKVRVAFTFDILKAGNRLIYKVERTYARKKGNENIADPKVARLIEIFYDENGDVTAKDLISDKPKEITQKIENLIGLTHDDFTRAVVLPQNKFQDFLMLKSADKRLMLERIFYLEEYGRTLIEKVSKKKNSVEKIFDATNSKLSVLDDASDDALSKANSNLKEALILFENINRTFALNEKKYIEAKEVWELICEKKQVLEAFSEIEKENEKIEIDRKVLNKAVKANVLQEIVDKFRYEEKMCFENDEKLKIVNQNHSENMVKLDETKVALNKASHEVLKVVPTLIDKRSKLVGTQTLVHEMNEIHEVLKQKLDERNRLNEEKAKVETELGHCEKNVEQLNRNIEEHKVNLKNTTVEIDYKNSINDMARIEDELNVSSRQIMVMQKEIEEINTKILGLNKQKEEYLTTQSSNQKNLDKVEKEIKELENTKFTDKGDIEQKKRMIFEMNVQEEKLVERITEINSNSEKITETEKSYLLNKCEFDDLNVKIEKVKVLISSNDEERNALQSQHVKSVAGNLASTLIAGEKCPVCGSLEHPEIVLGIDFVNEEQSIAKGESFEIKFLEIERRIQECNLANIAMQTDLRTFENELIENKIICENICNSKAQLMHDLTQKKSEFSDIAEKIVEVLKRFDIAICVQNIDFVNLKTEISEAIESASLVTKKLETSLDDWENKNKSKKEELVILGNILTTNDSTLNAVNVRLEECLDNFGQINQKLKACEKTDNEIRVKFEEFQLKHPLSKSAREEYLILVEREKKALEISNIIMQINEEIKCENDKIYKLRITLNELFSSTLSCETAQKGLKAQLDEKRGKVFAVVGIESFESDENIIGEEIKKVDDCIKAIQKTEFDLKEMITNIEAQTSTISIAKANLETHKQIFEKTISNLISEIQERLKAEGFSNVEEVEAALLSDEEMKLLKKVIEEFEKVSRNNEAHKNMIETRLAGRNIVEVEWNEISEQFEELQKIKEVASGELAVNRNICETIGKKNLDWKSLNQTLHAVQKKMDLLQELLRLLRGNSFIDFVAEERLRYIAKEASETLGLLTRNRYGIEIDSESSFIIRDNANGGVHRMAYTLSGGEMFLTSLALALALSKHIQLKGQSPLEFFFLDEGFGTLDSELLETVMDSLERLSSKERVIGLISHVPELRQRVARRLIVSYIDKNGAGSTVSVEVG